MIRALKNLRVLPLLALLLGSFASSAWASDLERVQDLVRVFRSFLLEDRRFEVAEPRIQNVTLATSLEGLFSAFDPENRDTYRQLFVPALTPPELPEDASAAILERLETFSFPFQKAFRTTLFQSHLLLSSTPTSRNLGSEVDLDGANRPRRSGPTPISILEREEKPKLRLPSLISGSTERARAISSTERIVRRARAQSILDQLRAKAAPPKAPGAPKTAPKPE